MRQTWRWMVCMTALAGCFGGGDGGPGPGVTGGQTGDEGFTGGDRGGAASEGNTFEGGPLAFCEEAEPTALELDADSALGYTPRQVLALAEGSETLPLYWNASVFPYGPEQGESTLSISVAARGGARYVDSQPKEMAAEIAVDCPSRLEVDVEVTIESGGGALDERFDAVLVSRDGALGRIDHRLDADALGGSLAFELPEGRDVRVHTLALSMVFSRYGSSGTLSAGFEERTGDAVSEYVSPQGGPLASWPTAGSCTLGGVPVPYDAGGEPVSAKAAVDAVNALPPLSMTGDDEALEVTLSLAHDGATVCAELEGSFGQPATGAVELGGTLDVTAADGSLDLSLGVRVRALPFDDGSLASVELRLDDRDPCGEWASDTPFNERCADMGVDLSAYDGAHLELDVAIDVEGDTPSVTGQLMVVGEVRPDCYDTPPEPQVDANGGSSSPGCPGIDSVTAAELELSVPN